MKELTATARNVYYAPDSENGILRPMVELILVTSEPTYSAQLEDGEIKLTQSRENETLRVACSVSGLNLLLKSVMEILSEVYDIQFETPAPQTDAD